MRPALGGCTNKPVPENGEPGFLAPSPARPVGSRANYFRADDAAASPVSSSPAPSSASALARRLGAAVSPGGWDDDGEKENDSVRTFRGEFDGENYLEDAREDRELREVDETVDAALRRMKTKGAFPERLTAEEMRRLVDECRSEQGA